MTSSLSRSEPTVTVIVATYNSATSLEFTLRSILNQTLQDFEVWVIGDACTDQTAAVVEGFGDTRLNFYNRTQNSGSQALPNNDGLERARGKYIAYLGHDDLWFPWHLSELVSALETQQADLVHAMCARLLPQGLQGIWGPPSTGKGYHLVHIPPSCILHLRGKLTWKAAEDALVGVDVDFLRRMSLSGHRIHFHPRLSVLKFPSGGWRAYDPRTPKPQQQHWKDLSDRPEALEHRILTEAAQVLSQHLNPLYPLPQLIRHLMRHLTYWLTLQGISENKLIHPLLKMHLNRTRKHKRKVRGLD
ncbi:glycosyltransferase family 2 protein [Deinococcus roseus]|uniref:Glycosyltransferase 2-like domain-containing protein n=1 Tax=Deinococcus roseus TaxID=392414 RepID=A0ABQ2CV57_9DEIO|nr:glycosyltransferase family A protein [Deinococcus roseus]GGJ20381.1 hypothetical protein GCM10008938_03260 [Deinococcus roseus]